MRTVYTITGTSSTRPTSLPAGFRVESQTEKFEHTIGAHHDGDRFAVKLTESWGDLHLALRESGSAKSDAGMYLNKAQARKLLAAVAEYVDETPALIVRVHELTRAGNKIQAIKEYREATGADLTGAKAAVERIAAIRSNRVLKDRDGDHWFEILADKFTMLPGRGSWADAERRVAEAGGVENCTFDPQDYVSRNYGPLTDVSASYPRD